MLAIDSGLADACSFPVSTAWQGNDETKGVLQRKTMETSGVARRFAGNEPILPAHLSKRI
jgi:hypothetical protein